MDYKIKSEFNIAVYFLYGILIAAAGIGTYTLFPMLREPDMSRLAFYVISAGIALFDIFAIVHPLISCYNVFYDGEFLEYRWTLIPRRKKIHAQNIEGFYTMKVPSKEDEYMTAFPLYGDRMLPAISSFYFDNYNDILKELPGREIARLKFSWRTYFRISVLKRKP